MSGANLPARRPEPSEDGPSGGAGRWGDEPPDPLVAPERYRGVIWRRILAYAVDLLILLFIMGLAFAGFLVAGVISLGILSPLLWIVFPLIPFAYHSLLIAGPKSATIGMRVFGVELRGWRGERPDLLQAAVVTALFYLSVGLTSFLILAVALFTQRHRTIHDILSNVVVVRRRKEEKKPTDQAPLATARQP